MELYSSNIDLGLLKKEEEKNEFWGFSAPPTHRYVMSYESSNILHEWYITTVTTPTISMVKSNGLTMNYSYNPIELTLISPIGKETSTMSLNEWFNEGIRKTVKLEKLDPAGCVIDRFILNNVIISELSYISGNTLDETLKITINYDRFTIL